jgi:hypothetical protein
MVIFKYQTRKSKLCTGSARGSTFTSHLKGKGQESNRLILHFGRCYEVLNAQKPVRFRVCSQEDEKDRNRDEISKTRSGEGLVKKIQPNQSRLR